MLAKNYYSPDHKLALNEAFLVIDSLNLRYNRKNNSFIPVAPLVGTETSNEVPFEPFVDVTVNLSVYASEFAYTSNAQALHSRMISFKTPNGTEEEIEAEILKLVQVTPK